MWGIRIGLTWIYIGMFGRDLKNWCGFCMIMDNISRCILLGACTREEKEACYYWMNIEKHIIV